MYSKRVKWLTQSSRKVRQSIKLFHSRQLFKSFLNLSQIFGLVNGDRVAVLIDSSNSNLGFGRAIEFQDSLLVNVNQTIARCLDLFLNLEFLSHRTFWMSSCPRRNKSTCSLTVARTKNFGRIR